MGCRGGAGLVVRVTDTLSDSVVTKAIPTFGSRAWVSVCDGFGLRAKVRVVRVTHTRSDPVWTKATPTVGSRARVRLSVCGCS